MVKKILAILISCLILAACQTDEGERMFEEALELSNAGKHDEAIQNFIALTKAFPNHHLLDDSLFWIANINEHYLDDPDQAIRFYRSLNKQFENSEYRYQSMIGLARVYIDQGDGGKRKAVRIYQRIKKIELPAEEKQKNQYQLAQLFLELKEYEKARIELKNLILDHEKSRFVSKAYHLIGSSYYLEGKKKLAEITFLETDRKFNHSRESLASAISLADIYEELDNLQSAIKVYDSIIKRLEITEVYYHLAKDRIERLKSRLKKTNTG